MPIYNPYMPMSSYPNAYGYNPYAAMPMPLQQQPQTVQQPPQQPVQQTAPQQNAQPIPSMNGGFVHVQSENEARQYPVAPGNSVTFIDDVLPFCYTKTMPTTQFEPPMFKKFKLVEVVEAGIAQNASGELSERPKAREYNLEDYALKTDLEALRAEIGRIESEIKNLMPKSKSKTVKEADTNEQST